MLTIMLLVILWFHIQKIGSMSWGRVQPGLLVGPTPL